MTANDFKQSLSDNYMMTHEAMSMNMTEETKTATSYNMLCMATYGKMQQLFN